MRGDLMAAAAALIDPGIRVIHLNGGGSYQHVPVMSTFEWTTPRLEYLINNYFDKTLKSLAEHFGISIGAVYAKACALKMPKKGNSGKYERSPETTRRMIESIEKNAEARALAWPKITTTMGDALAGRSFGGDTSKPGTKNPKPSRMQWSGDLGSAKSSMG